MMVKINNLELGLLRVRCQAFSLKNTGVGSHSLLQDIFPTQGLNLGFPHCGQIPYHLNHQGSPKNRLTICI